MPASDTVVSLDLTYLLRREPSPPGEARGRRTGPSACARSPRGS